MLISKREVARMLSVSTRTVDRYRAAGLFKVVKLNRHTVRFNKEQIDEAVRKGLKVN